MALKLRELILICLKEHPEQNFTSREIAQWIYKTYPKRCAAKLQRSDHLQSVADLVRQITGETSRTIHALQKRNRDIKMVGDRPHRFCYSKNYSRTKTNPAPLNNLNDKELNEHQLYSVLSIYLWRKLNLYPKQINKKNVQANEKSNEKHWLYPDIVAMEDIGRDWNRETKDCIKHYADRRTTLWSFEVKCVIRPSNVRECYFQTVSNSAWANFGYLVAAKIDGGDKTLKELRMLFASHGIGLIQLDPENPDKSQILIPAREQTAINWDTINRFSEENKDFSVYITLIKEFYQTDGSTKPADWDIPKQAI